MKEVLFCESCGEEAEFKCKWEEPSKQFELDCDNNGVYNDDDYQDALDFESRHQRQPEPEFECGVCGGAVMMMEEDDILECKVQHTDNKGKWHKDVLPEEQWNKELNKELLAKRV
jgi:hypothetical protein